MNGSPAHQIDEPGVRANPRRRGMLATQLHWFVSLRWLAAAVVLVCGLLNWRWLHWYEPVGLILAVGIFIPIYNAALWLVLRRAEQTRSSPRFLVLLAWVQILLDVACLTLLMSWTGGQYSIVSRFFVFHMVFASLLLPRLLAYTSAAVAVSMILGTLWIGGHWPQERQEGLILIGQLVALFFLVFLANRITRGLRRQRRRLRRQNRRIRAMSQQLRQQQQAMIQHEKMVAMGRMAAGVTHEIANPLACMDSLLQLMQRRSQRMTPDQLVTLRQQVERITQIIRQMKAFAHPTEAQKQVLPLNMIVDQALEMVRFDKRFARVQVVRDFSPDVGSIPMFPQALQQVIINLIINALDAMERTEAPQLRLRTARRDAARIIEISDNGHGIKPELMRRLFEPFFTTKSVGQGTGLGLSISYSLVQKHGGAISARSDADLGTTFTIRLPAGDETPVISHSREQVISSAAASEKPAVG